MWKTKPCERTYHLIVLGDRLRQFLFIFHLSLRVTLANTSPVSTIRRCSSPRYAALGRDTPRSGDSVDQQLSGVPQIDRTWCEDARSRQTEGRRVPSVVAIVALSPAPSLAICVHRWPSVAHRAPSPPSMAIVRHRRAISRPTLLLAAPCRADPSGRPSPDCQTDASVESAAFDAKVKHRHTDRGDAPADENGAANGAGNAERRNPRDWSFLMAIAMRAMPE